MAPIVERTPQPQTIGVSRPTVRARRRGPMPLEQIPAWGDLVPVMDPAIGRPPVPEGMDGLSAASTRTSSAPLHTTTVRCS